MAADLGTRMETHGRLEGVLYASCVVVLFSGFVVVSRMGFSTALTVPDIAALRFGIGGLILSPILMRYGRNGLRLRETVALAVLGGLGFALFAYAGFALAPTAHGAVLLHGTLSLTTAFLILTFTGKAPSRGRSTSLAVIVSGIAAMAWDASRTLPPPCSSATPFCCSPRDVGPVMVFMSGI